MGNPKLKVQLDREQKARAGQPTRREKMSDEQRRKRRSKSKGKRRRAK